MIEAVQLRCTLLLCNKVPPNLAASNNNLYSLTQFLRDRNLGMAKLGGSGSVSHRVALRISDGATVIEGLGGVAESASMMAHAHSYWLDAPASPHMDLSIELFECPHDMATSSSRECNPRRETKEKAKMSFVSYLVHHSVTRYSSEVSHYIQPTLKRRKMKVCHLKGGLSKNL